MIGPVDPDHQFFQARHELFVFSNERINIFRGLITLLHLNVGGHAAFQLRYSLFQISPLN